MTRRKTYVYLVLSVLLFISVFIMYKYKVSNYSKKSQVDSSLLISLFVFLISVTSLILNSKIYENKFLKSLVDWLSFIPTVVNSILIVFTFFIIVSTVNGESMMPTLKDKEKVIVSHFNYKPQKNDLIVVKMRKKDYEGILDNNYLESLFQYEDEYYIVKRLKALPGDKITLKPMDGDSVGLNIYINDELLMFNNQAYLVSYNSQLVKELESFEYILKENDYLVLGDNTTNSTDSRQTGFVEFENIIGKVVFHNEKDN